MGKKITLIVPDDTISLIVAYQIIEGFDITMGQTTISTNSIKEEHTLDLNKEWVEAKAKE